MNNLTDIYPKNYETDTYTIQTVTYRGEYSSSEFAGQNYGDKIVVLSNKRLREVVMSSSEMEIRTNKDIIKRAKGDVLIAGLGLAMIIFDIQKKDNVDSITIIEKDVELINLITSIVGGKLNEKVKIINDDIFEYETEQKFDTIYFDIWNNTCESNYEEMLHLRNKFKKNLKSRFIKKMLFSWREDDTKRLWKEKND